MLNLVTYICQYCIFSVHMMHIIYSIKFSQVIISHYRGGRVLTVGPNLNEKAFKKGFKIKEDYIEHSESP